MQAKLTVKGRKPNIKRREAIELLLLAEKTPAEIATATGAGSNLIYEVRRSLILAGRMTEEGRPIPEAA